MLHWNRRDALRLLGTGTPFLFDKAQAVTGTGPLEVAAAQFDATPPVGVPAPTFGANPVVRRIEGKLLASVFALRQGSLTIAWSGSDYYIFDETRRRMAQSFSIPLEQTVASNTHNHSNVAEPAVRLTHPFGQELFRRFDAALASLKNSFVPATVSWGAATESGITYNRKGRRADGSTYFMREEDRVKLPASYTGTIDAQASIIRFDGPDRQPRLVLTHFTGHPVIAYNLEEPVINPDYCGWALQDLLSSFGTKPPTGVFLQGCAGDINAKGMFAGPKLARESGARLGRAFIAANRSARRVTKPVLATAHGIAYVPYAPLPSLEELERQKKELLDFQRRAEAGDPDTLHVLGYNFSETQTVAYRKNLAKPMLIWTDWAISMQKAGNAMPEQSWPLPVQAIAIGDVAFVTMPCEAFVGIGLDIRRRSPFRLTIPAAYTNGIHPNYIGTSKDVGDREYMSAFYRYVKKQPYAKPAGDVIADKAVELLTGLHRAIHEL